MKASTFMMKKLLGLTAAALLTGTVALHADTFYHVDINTASLSLDPNAPFSIDFSMTEGSTTLSNTAKIQNIVLTGGTSDGPTVDFSAGGTTSGSIASGFILNDAGGYAEISQPFSLGTTDIQFDLDLTQASTGTQPDGFFINILDNSTFDIPTTNPDGSNSLASFTIGNATGFPGTTFSTGAIALDGGNVTITVQSVPEPSTYALVLFAVGALVALRRRVSRRVA